MGDWGVGFGLLYIYLDDFQSPVITIPMNLDATLKLDSGRMYVGLTAATGISGKLSKARHNFCIIQECF